MNALKYTKAIVATLAAGVIVVSGIMTGVPVNLESVAAVLAAFGVFALPNSEASK